MFYFVYPGTRPLDNGTFTRLTRSYCAFLVAFLQHWAWYIYWELGMSIRR